MYPESNSESSLSNVEECIGADYLYLQRQAEVFGEKLGELLLRLEVL